MSKFTDAIGRNWPVDDWSIVNDCTENGFSWGACECCGASDGGDRYELTAIKKRNPGEVASISACIDCALYIANGDEPETWEG